MKLRTPISISIVTLAVVAQACSLGGTPEPTEPQPGVTTAAPQPNLPPPNVDGAVDRTVELRQGDLAVADVEEKLSGEVNGYVAGSGEHLASFDGADGRMDIFSFRTDEAGGNGQPGAIVVCRAVVQRDRRISGFSCTGEQAQPPRTGIHSVSTQSGDGTTDLLVGVGLDVESVLVEFDTGRRWRLVPANGVAFAEWPWGIGSPTRLIAIAADGSIDTAEF